MNAPPMPIHVIQMQHVPTQQEATLVHAAQDTLVMEQLLVPISMNALQVSILAMQMQHVPTLQEATLVHAAQDTLVMEQLLVPI